MKYDYSKLQCADCGKKPTINEGPSRIGNVWKCEECWHKPEGGMHYIQSLIDKLEHSGGLSFTPKDSRYVQKILEEKILEVKTVPDIDKYRTELVNDVQQVLRFYPDQAQAVIDIITKQK